MKEKPQTPSQRVANPVWLREQISELIEVCDASIGEDQELADAAWDDLRDYYLSRVESHRHWRMRLERILRGKTFTEDLRDATKPINASRGRR